MNPWRNIVLTTYYLREWYRFWLAKLHKVLYILIVTLNYNSWDDLSKLESIDAVTSLVYVAIDYHAIFDLDSLTRKVKGSSPPCIGGRKISKNC